MSFQKPVANPARKAIPRAVVSVVFGLITLVFNRSDWICIKRLLLLAPPSTFKLENFIPASFSISIIISLVLRAIDSRAALAIWPFSVPLVIPKIVPWAYGSQYGAASPDRAGTNVIPPLSFTVFARFSTSGASLIIPSLSLNHWIRAPATKTLPSRAYVTSPFIRQAIVESILLFDLTNVFPVFIMQKQPVP